MALAALGLGACAEQPQPLKIDNALTPAEIEAGLLTPGNPLEDGPRRLGIALARRLETPLRGHALQPRRELRTHADLRPRHGQRRGQRADRPPLLENNSPAWSADGRTIRFLSDRSGSMQVWEMNPEGGDLRQPLAARRRHRGLRHQPRGDKAWYVRRVQVCDRKSSDVYAICPTPKHVSMTTLMSRHWDYWDGDGTATSSWPTSTATASPRAPTSSAPMRPTTRRWPLFRHGGDRLEPCGHDAGLHLQTPRGHRLRADHRFGRLRLRRSVGSHAEHLQTPQLRP